LIPWSHPIGIQSQQQIYIIARYNMTSYLPLFLLTHIKQQGSRIVQMYKGSFKKALKAAFPELQFDFAGG